MDIFAYYFPNYHADPRNESRYGKGWNEWKLLQDARPRFDQHQQPKVPLWGYEDESTPAVMAAKIKAAKDHHLTGFIFDWYWYEDGPFLHRALDEGFLGAPNCNDLKFAIMWANHDWVDLFPASARQSPELLHPGRLSMEGWERLTDRVVEKYFSHPSYWLIDGCPYFSIYEMASFIQGLGGLEMAIRAIDLLRTKVRAAGFPDVHLNIVAWGLSEWSFKVLPVEERVLAPIETAQKLGTSSVAPYVWVHHYDVQSIFPRNDYQAAAKANYDFWDSMAQAPFDFFPNVTMGWDSSPRTVQSEPYKDHGYPFASVLEASPAQFEQALHRAKRWMEAHPQEHKAITINAWNEWTEGSYLEPDTMNGFGYLEAIRKVFADPKRA